MKREYKSSGLAGGEGGGAAFKWCVTDRSIDIQSVTLQADQSEV